MSCPAELADVARRFDAIEDQVARNAIADAMGHVLDAALVLRQDQTPDGPPLTAEQRAVIDYLRKHGVTPAEELADHSGYCTKTVKRWCRPGGLLSKHGVVATARGYAIDSRRAGQRPLLTAEQQATLDHLRKHGITPAEDLSHHIGYCVRTISSWCGPNGPLRAHGVVATKKGYGLAE